MKKVRNCIIGISNSVISLLLTLLGFTSCEKSETYLYGTPPADFQILITGTVTNEATNQPVPNIKVKTDQDSMLTDGEGRYATIYYGFPPGDILKIQYVDIDGQANGEFQQLDKGVGVADAKFSGGDGKWYRGMAIKEVDVALKEKK